MILVASTPKPCQHANAVRYCAWRIRLPARAARTSPTLPRYRLDTPDGFRTTH
ncbi:hypothetical protein [Komagataeibacter xylinus]|uniref:hypothetical protein n=1 Tax=Komagataeibacter xylinus TaxID=28448 RepID=UPI00280BCBA1|nr:hypothetical protein [Komagataeibacter xylinus]